MVSTVVITKLTIGMIQGRSGIEKENSIAATKDTIREVTIVPEIIYNKK